MRVSRSPLACLALGLVLAKLTGASAMAQGASQAAKPAAPAAKAGTPAGTPVVASQIDLNRATAKQLEVLPGVGPATAAKIIAGRPYANKQQLLSRGLVTQAVYDRIKDRIVAKQ
jgi:competence protein ComEA